MAGAIRRWFTAMWAWLREANWLWLALSLPLLAWAYTHWAEIPHDPAIRARWASTGLQLAGIISVYVGYEKTREQFGHALTHNWVLQWLKRVPWHGPRIVSGSGTAKVTAAAMAALEGQDVTLLASGQPIEARLAHLEAEVRRLENERQQIRRELRQEGARWRAALQEHRQGWTDRADEISRKLEAAQTGGLNLSIAGLLWVGVGLLF